MTTRKRKITHATHITGLLDSTGIEHASEVSALRTEKLGGLTHLLQNPLLGVLTP